MIDARFDRVIRSIAAARSRRAALGALGATLAALLRVAPVAACKGNGQGCRNADQCCSQRCRKSRCKAKRLVVGDLCQTNADCRSGVCGRLTSVASICRVSRCLRAGRGCTLATECCTGYCNAATLECVG